MLVPPRFSYTSRTCVPISSSRVYPHRPTEGLISVMMPLAFGAIEDVLDRLEDPAVLRFAFSESVFYSPAVAHVCRNTDAADDPAVEILYGCVSGFEHLPRPLQSSRLCPRRRAHDGDSR